MVESDIKEKVMSREESQAYLVAEEQISECKRVIAKSLQLLNEITDNFFKQYPHLSDLVVELNTSDSEESHSDQSRE